MQDQRSPIGGAVEVNKMTGTALPSWPDKGSAKAQGPDIIVVNIMGCCCAGFFLSPEAISIDL